MTSAEKHSKLIAEMHRDREALVTKAKQLEVSGLVHASKRYYAAAAAVRRAYQQLVESGDE